ANVSGPIFAAAPVPTGVAVAMSGGVDSAVALLRAGPAAIGVTLRLWIDPRAPSSERACCSPEAVIAARETCHELGIPHVTLDAREAFRRAIVAPFVDAYARGETPNPCTRCNGSFRFAQLLAFARRAGAARLATGHYARIVEHRGRLLLRGRERSSTNGARFWAHTAASGASPRASGEVSVWRRARPSMPSAPMRARTRSSSGPARRWPAGR